MRQFILKLSLLILLVSRLVSSVCEAQTIPAHAEGLSEQLVTIELDKGRTQSGVLSIRIGTTQHTRLVVLLPGHPSVVRPIVEGGVMTSSRLTGNFLIRARRFLPDHSIATLVVDCHSDSGDECSNSYQISKEREADVQKLIGLVLEKTPSIKQVWLVGTSAGTLSSSFMPVHNPLAYAGAIHTASITDPYVRGLYRELVDFDYNKAQIPQYFIHHRDDPCFVTPYHRAKLISEKFERPMISVSGGSGFQGDACGAYSQHGFRGKEKEVMTLIGNIVKTGKSEQTEIN